MKQNDNQILLKTIENRWKKIYQLRDQMKTEAQRETNNGFTSETLIRLDERICAIGREVFALEHQFRALED